MKTIVLSAVNIVEAGPLAILKDCLASLSQWVAEQPDKYRIIAIVYIKELADYPHIEYIETQWPKKRWINRLWYEYVSLKRVSKAIGPVYLWFSLHDTTPNVIAERQAVYCHNALSFYKWKFQDFLFAPKMTLLAILTKYVYRPNIHQNDYLVVQQAWFREGMSKMYDIDRHKIIVSPPAQVKVETVQSIMHPSGNSMKSFIYAASPNKHKNFEVICKAVEILENQYHIKDIQMYITVSGKENKYARWLYKNWGRLTSIRFIGFLPKETLQDYYNTCDAMIYPSKAESWGLPISEFAVSSKPMLLADLPYAHETAAGSQQTAFFDPDKPEALAKLMNELIKGNTAAFRPVPPVVVPEPIARDWATLFRIMMEEQG